MSQNTAQQQPSTQLAIPPRMRTAEGEPRLVGIEIEFGGLTLEQTAILLVDQLKATLSNGSDYEATISGDPAGDWRVELDFELLKDFGRRNQDEADTEPSLQSLINNGIEQLLKLMAEPLVPVEIVSPPLPFARLPEVQSLITALREAGALGTGENPVFAFGLQLNPQPPALDARTLLSHFKAYLCLADWLRQRANVDLTRRLTLFAEPFPKAYVRQVIAPDYWPDQSAFIDDYLSANPTRNRELDLLPLFAHLDPERVKRRVADSRVKARPTFHYRLPNSEIDQPDWGLHTAWNDWVEVERLAEDPERLSAIRGAYLERLSQLLGGRLNPKLDDWAQETAQWLTPTRDH
ncbi:Putative amidoligase enzyme [Thiorhodovibrio winogradskyi]|uniref:Amidoligase enzyme n=1 Tax=Thiorhodovibrio winogradskyi TaxID=77007 RepID=A0ABZ0SI29_9GAMM|nr:amidoligase family protein [Thiorhodovibrio winogradskyi]